MSTRAQVIATLLLFVLMAAYGLQALSIPLFPGQELEPFKPRTMPLMLAATGLLLCAIRIFQLARGPAMAGGKTLAGFNWGPPLLLCLAMLGYGFLMIPAGFVVSTALFLASGFAILGERRKAVLIVLPITFSVAFFLLMTGVLGLYLAPGRWTVF